MNEILFASFTTPTIMNIPIALFILALPSLLFPSPFRLINNRIVSMQQWTTNLILKRMMITHRPKGQTWSLKLVSLIIFIGTTILLGLLPHSFTPTTQLSMNLGMAIPLWAGTVAVGFRHKSKASLAHLLPQGTPTFLIPMLLIIETISLLIQPVALAVRLTPNITAGHMLMYLTPSATLALMPINPMASLTSFGFLAQLTILEFAVAVIQAYVFTLLISLYLHINT
uniref:ATP synthase subunit a n=1 Tax=Bradypus variegatus TaxID=9355 RepID=A0A2D1WBD5_BRAVA|nr:ATP synthase F0 subunit 6 [Bradypus variegatus]